MVCDSGNFMYCLVIVAWVCCFVACVCCFMIMCGGDVLLCMSCFVVAVCTCCFAW